MANHPALCPEICNTLGIEVPIVQAGMGFIARAQLAAAVSEAGGLGMIGAASLSADELRSDIRKVRALTDRPFGVDILFATSRKPAADVATGQLKLSVQEHVDPVFEERVPVLASGLGDPGPVVSQAHDLGITVTRCFSGKPARMIRNQTTEAWESPELQQRIRPFPRQFGVMNEWLGEDPYTTGRFDGKTETGALAAGQSSSVIRSVLPVREIMRSLVEETNAALERLAPRS